MTKINQFINAKIFYLLFFINKVHGRLKREYLYLPIISNLYKKAYINKISEYHAQLPVLDNRNSIIFNDLRDKGIHITNIDSLLNPRSTATINTANKLLLDSSNLVTEIGCKGNYGVPGRALQKYPEIVLWALEENLIDIVENYIELPIFYLGAEVKRCFPNREITGIRNWHLDTEDYRMVKILIYLNDVDDKGGQFQCIPADQSDVIKKKLRYKFGLVSDALMEQYISSRDWVSVLGKKYTVIFVDTARLFHRAKPPIARDRLSITFHYISQHPL
ncbi:MAG: hypothetical protein AB4372_09355, partial [Xenococcus sp. (in: cyanobacteria)]